MTITPAFIQFSKVLKLKWCIYCIQTAIFLLHRWSLLLQDKEGAVCEVMLPADVDTSPDQWCHLLECEGKEIQVAGLRIQQRVNSTR